MAGQVVARRREVRLTRATESLSSPLLFWASSLLTISVPVRVRDDSRMRAFDRSTRGWRQKLETRYTRAWTRGEPWRLMLVLLMARMVTFAELHICLRREKVTDRR